MFTKVAKCKPDIMLLAKCFPVNFVRSGCQLVVEKGIRNIYKIVT